MKRTRWLVKLLILLALPITAGCAAAVVAGGAAVGAGSAAFLSGQLESEEGVSFGVAWKATQKAAEDLGYTITSKENGDFWGELIARDSNGKKLTVKLRSPKEGRTTIKIRVGFFGDEASSRRVLDEIRKRY